MLMFSSFFITHRVLIRPLATDDHTVNAFRDEQGVQMVMCCRGQLRPGVGRGSGVRNDEGSAAAQECRGPGALKTGGENGRDEANQ